MKFSCSKDTILEAVTVTSKASASKASISALEGLLLNLKDNSLTVTGYDMEIGISTTIPVENGENGDVVINARMLSDIIRKMPSGVINFDIDEGKTAKITVNDTKMSVMCTKADEFPSIPRINGENGYTIPQKILKSMISQTKHACAVTDTKPALKGCFFDGDENGLNVVACDGIRLGLRTEPVNIGGSKFILSIKTIEELIHLLSDEDDKNITICIDKNQISFKIDGYTMISRIINGEYMDYKRFIVMDAKNIAEINCREIIEVLERVILLINDKYKTPVKLEFSGDTLRMTCTTIVGEIDDKIAIKYSGEPFTVGFNAKYLIESFKAAECDRVKLLMTSSPASPVIIVPMEGREFTFLIVPIRLK